MHLSKMPNGLRFHLLAATTWKAETAQQSSNVYWLDLSLGTRADVCAHVYLPSIERNSRKQERANAPQPNTTQQNEFDA